MREKMAKRISEAAHQVADEPAPITQVTSEEDGFGVHFRDLPTMLQAVAIAAAEVGPPGSSHQDAFIEDLALINTWDGVEDDMILA